MRNGVTLVVHAAVDSSDQAAEPPLYTQRLEAVRSLDHIPACQSMGSDPNHSLIQIFTVKLTKDLRCETPIVYGRNPHSSAKTDKMSGLP